MPAQRLTMRRVRELLRLHYGAGGCSPSVDQGSRREIDADPRVISPVPFKAPASLTAGEGGRLQIGTVAAFKSESWPASDRNGGRHHVGKGGRLPLESALVPYLQLQTAPQRATFSQPGLRRSVDHYLSCVMPTRRRLGAGRRQGNSVPAEVRKPRGRAQ